MEYEHILVERSGDFATVTMNRPQRRTSPLCTARQRSPRPLTRATAPSPRRQ